MQLASDDSADISRLFYRQLPVFLKLFVILIFFGVSGIIFSTRRVIDELKTSRSNNPTQPRYTSFLPEYVEIS